MWSVQKTGYRIWAPTCFDFHGPGDENIDVHVVLDDEREYVATFFSLRCVELLMRKLQLEDELPVAAFWESSPIIVPEVSEEVVCALIDELVRRGELEAAFDLGEGW